MTGRLVGVGVGPGDPELLTLKAARAIASADVVAYIAAPGRASRARTIAAAHLPEGCDEIAVTMPMDGSAADRAIAYRELVDAIEAAVARGRRVVFLCEGDPMLYGSFLHVLARLRHDGSIEIVPGISSASAAAAACAMPLAVRDEPLTLVPATAGEPTLRALAGREGTLVVLKLGERLPMVQRVLAETGRLARARLVVELGGAAEDQLPLAEASRAPYFSLVLSPGTGA